MLHPRHFRKRILGLDRFFEVCSYIQNLILNLIKQSRHQYIAQNTPKTPNYTFDFEMCSTIHIFQTNAMQYKNQCFILNCMALLIFYIIQQQLLLWATQLNLLLPHGPFRASHMFATWGDAWEPAIAITNRTTGCVLLGTVQAGQTMAQPWQGLSRARRGRSYNRVPSRRSGC